MKANVIFTRFPGGNSEHPDTTDWMIETVIKAKSDPRIGDVMHWREADTPITMVRNKAVKVAKAAGADFMVMIDSDMRPDLSLKGAKKFWDTAWPFMIDPAVRAEYGIAHTGPCIIGAPYCGKPPHENVFIFRWTTMQSDHPNPDFRLDQFPREEAALRTGIEEVAALPTGLIIIDMRVFDYLESPYFYYEYMDAEETEKASTEDVTFTRDATMAGVPCYVAWDCWAGHHKSKCVGKPGLIYVDDMKEKFQRAIRQGLRSNVRLVARKREQHGQFDPRSFGKPGGRLSGSGPVAAPTQGCFESIQGGVERGAGSEREAGCIGEGAVRGAPSENGFDGGQVP
jgi:hypothetical protein